MAKIASAIQLMVMGMLCVNLLNFISACYWLPLCGAFFCFESSSFILFSYSFIAYLNPCIIHHEIVYFAMLNRNSKVHVFGGGYGFICSRLFFLSFLFVYMG
jgi:hypothetical protein